MKKYGPSMGSGVSQEESWREDSLALKQGEEKSEAEYHKVVSAYSKPSLNVRCARREATMYLL